jgi:hypothetical protein
MPASLNQEIESLLGELERSNQQNGSDSNESKNIRKKLRALGHYGGLRTRDAK